MTPPRPSYVWLTARARNAMRRRAAMAIVAAVTFVTVLIGLVLVPREVTRVARAAYAAAGVRQDTTAAASRRAGALRAMASADSELQRARELVRPAAPPPPPPDTLSPELRVERDSLQMLLTSLSAAMERAASSPLPPAFRSLAQTPALAGNARVSVLLDSLDQLDRLREPFGALGAGDPIYVALTARVNEIGRAIRDAAQERRSELRARLAPLLAPPPAPASAPNFAAAHVDTVRFLRKRALAALELQSANAALDSLRRHNARVEAAAGRARSLANVGAPPLAMLAAALVVALAAAFAVVFTAEVRHPRIAHLREGEAVSGTRVLAVIRPTVVVERGRRQADVEGPPLIDIVSDAYRMLYLHLAATEANVPVITVTGDIPVIVATIAANLAAVAAYEARSTLLVDADPASRAIASVLRIRPDPGLTAVLAKRADITEAIVSTTIGRDRPLDVLPSGSGRIGSAAPGAIARARDALARMERRYDFMVIAAAPGYVQLTTETIIPAPNVIVCAQIGVTRIADLRMVVKSLRGARRNVHGVVLWDDETPRLRLE